MSLEKLDERGFLIRSYIKVDQATKIAGDITTLDNYVKNSSKNETNILDIEWIRNRFSISNKELSEERLINGRFFSTASFKYSNTRLGGHLACNPKPQWTRYADIRPRYNPTLPRGREYMTIASTNRDSNTSLGRYYSEAIDDNANLVFLTFGVKKFNGLLDFMMSAIDYGDVIVANTGREPYFYNIGNFVGSFVVFACFPFTTAIVWATKTIANFLNMDRGFNYYYMEPAMHVYWSTVHLLVTQLASELKFISPIIENRTKPLIEGDVHDMGMPTTLEKGELEHIAQILGGDIFNAKTGHLDIYAIMSKPQAMYRDFLRRKKEELEKAGDSSQIPLTDEYGALMAIPSGDEDIYDDVQASADALRSTNIASFQDYLNRVIKQSDGDGANKDSNWAKQEENTVQTPAAGTTTQSDISKAQAELQGSLENQSKEARSSDTQGFVHNFNEGNKEHKSWIKKAKETADSVIHDGGLSAIFSVDYVGSLSESFNNDIRDIDTGGMLKSVAAGAQDIKFNFSGGNLGGPIDTGAIMSAVKETVMGAASGVTMGLTNVLATVFGDAYTDIPKRWGDSSTSFPTITYNTKLACIYGNDYNRMQNIVIPLCMLIAGAVPLATGKSSYTSPFLCSITSQGVQNIKLGMITSLNISRGTTNLPFTKNRKPLGVDVSFTVTDFSTLVAAPVTKGMFAEILNFGMDDGSPMGRYLATLAGRDIQTDKYLMNKLGMRLARARVNLESLISPYRVGSKTGFALNGLLSLFTAQGNLTTSLPGLSTR